MAISAILNFSKYSTFDLDDIEGRVIPLFKGFPGYGSPFLELFLGYGIKIKVKSEVKFDLKPGTNHLYRPYTLQ